MFQSFFNRIPKALIILLNCISTLALAHGEDKPGPHGGFIRMPGGFHTEILPVDKNKLKVYLLDINWQNPSIKESSLDVSFGNNADRATCDRKENLFYLCSFSKKTDLTKKGKLTVTSMREGQKGNAVTYDLPLNLKAIDDGHNGKH